MSGIQFSATYTIHGSQGSVLGGGHFPISLSLRTNLTYNRIRLHPVFFVGMNLHFITHGFTLVCIRIVDEGSTPLHFLKAWPALFSNQRVDDPRGEVETRLSLEG